MYSSLKYIIIVFLMLCSIPTSAQLLNDYDLDTASVYTNINDANLNAEYVYILDLSKQKLDQFPRDILKYKNLNVLIISKNKLKKIPDSISELKYLQKLDISKNKVTDLPSSLYDLENIKELDISDNPIPVVSYKIMQLKKMERFSLWGLPIEKLPEQVLELPKLEYLDIRQIHFSKADKENIFKKLQGVEIKTTSTCDCGV